MKRSKHQLLWSLAAALLAGTFLVSCSDDATELSSGTLLEGKYPLVLTAEIDGEATRASGKDAFAESDEIGVMLGTESTGKYVIGSDGKTLSPYDTDNTIYWQKLEATTVTGWYPYETQTSVNISDQSSGYADFDYLTATAENQAVGNTVKLKFQHQMAKVSFTLAQGTDIDLSTATVKVLGYTTATFSEGTLSTTDDTNGEITPYYDSETSTYEVLLVPQDMSNQQFIVVTSTSGTSYYYTPTSANLEAGCSYTFDINVGGDYTYDSSSNTYTVYTEAGLNAWATAAATDLTTDCILGNDITMSGTWTAVGTDTANDYEGTFDGNNCTIKNLTISSTSDNQGLIGYLSSSGTVQDLTLESANITITTASSGNTGAVVGYNNGGTISGCTVSGSVTGTNNVGGVVGNNGGTISNCSSSATVNGTAYTGGVVGLNAANSTITNCYSTGTVTGTGNYIGGVVGNSSGTITACYYSTGTVSGDYNVGGVAGLSSGTISACYSTGAVSATSNNIGGIVGNNSGTITACYSSGSVSGSSYVGGAVGRNQSAGTVTTCYWSNSNTTYGIGSSSSNEGAVQVGSDDCADWSTAASNMNTELTGSGWQYSGDGTTDPPLSLVVETTS